MLLFAPEFTLVSEFTSGNFGGGGMESRVCNEAYLEAYFKTMLNKEEK